MEKFEAKFGHWVLRHRWLIIILTLVLVFIAASGGKNLSFTTNYRVFFGADNPELLAFEALENTYTKNDNVMIVLTPKDGNVFTPSTLAVVEELTKKAWQIPCICRVLTKASSVVIFIAVSLPKQVTRGPSRPSRKALSYTGAKRYRNGGSP